MDIDIYHLAFGFMSGFLCTMMGFIVQFVFSLVNTGLGTHKGKEKWD